VQFKTFILGDIEVVREQVGESKNRATGS
jgi:hypothetical protein